MKNRINKYINLQHQQKVLNSQQEAEDETERGSSSLDFFEFLYDPEETYNMSHAEDIIFCGKLLPKDHYKIHHQQSDIGDGNISRRHHLPETNTSSSDSESVNNPSKTTAIRSYSRSFDRNNKPKQPHHRSPKSNVSSDVHHQHQRFNKTSMNKSREDNKKNNISYSKLPSWHFIVFGGLLKLVSPPEIDIRDMKNRQSRLSSTTFLPAGRSKRSSDLLTVLSCKSNSSVGFEEPASIIVRRPTSAVVR